MKAWEQSCGRMPVNATTAFLFALSRTSELYSLSLHDALPIFDLFGELRNARPRFRACLRVRAGKAGTAARSEEHTSELQSQSKLVCRLLLEKNNEFKQIMELHTHSSNNTIYADADGNIAYFHG